MYSLYCLSHFDLDSLLLNVEIILNNIQSVSLSKNQSTSADTGIWLSRKMNHFCSYSLYYYLVFSMWCLMWYFNIMLAFFLTSVNPVQSAVHYFSHHSPLKQIDHLFSSIGRLSFFFLYLLISVFITYFVFLSNSQVYISLLQAVSKFCLLKYLASIPHSRCLCEEWTKGFMSQTTLPY